MTDAERNEVYVDPTAPGVTFMRRAVEVLGAVATVCAWFEWVRNEEMFHSSVRIGLQFARDAFEEGHTLGRQAGRDAAIAELTPTLTTKITA